VEDGTHEQLLEQGGAYHRLWSRQAGGFVFADGAADRSPREETAPTEEDEAVDTTRTSEELVGNDRRRVPRRIY
jgi:ATP-binding cassette subfamily B protein